MGEKQKLSLYSFTMIVVGLVIGMGIFRAAATSAKDALSPAIYFTAWGLGGLIALCGALTYAEIGSRFPETGGYYKIYSYAYHPSIAFAINCVILISNAASVSGVAIVGSTYLVKLFAAQGFTEAHIGPISAGAILAFYGVNLAGLTMSARVQNVLMAIKIAMLLLLISGLFLPGKYVTQATTHTADILPLSWIRSLGVALVSVSFVYGGYQQTINFGNDVRNPVRNVPRGIFAGIALIIVLYLLVNGSYYNIVGFNQMKNDRAIAHTAIGNLFGNQAAQVFSGFLFIGVLAYVNALLLSNPRVMYAMGSEGSLPKVFARQNTRNNVLTFSLTVFAALCLIVLAFSQEFEKILNFSIFLDCFGMVASSATLFKLRRQTRHLDGTGIYKMKLYPLLPLLFIAAYLFIGASIAIEQPRIALTGILVLGGFIGLYFLLQVRRKPQ